MYADAIHEYEISRILSGKNPELVKRQAAELAEAYGSGGAESYWRKRLDLLRVKNNASSYSVAQVHAMLGKLDDAFVWLGKAYDESSPNIIYSRVDPRFQGLRPDPRFASLLRRIGLS